MDMRSGQGETALADKIQEEGNEKFYLGLFGEFRASYASDSTGKSNGFRERWKRDKLFQKCGGWRTELDFWEDGALEDMSIVSVERLEEMPEEWFPVLETEAERRPLRKRNLDTLPREKFTDVGVGSYPKMDKPNRVTFRSLNEESLKKAVNFFLDQTNSD
ncbi:hypothetical protein AKJ39_01355 [candidate division MSBL1 archaeon SCGC-AAA259J03]|uniref:Uncharacterized protein n=1 Tax=candidate division MSBL1 archaeon SCGC-AAA259J03 TaxID=1698269 RepID=A0A656YWR2_9EURY|nr:hypothetical protein AKJ39_01355 [candidate division MSBL1 archaeon SCGC-AAA259J03]